jgi:hypothetical protein
MISYDDLYETGAEEAPGFVATRHELRQLVKYWATVVLEDQYSSFLYDDVADPQLGWPRIGAVARFLGDEETRKAVDEAFEEFGAKQDRRVWHIFRNGTPNEREQMQNEIYQDREKRMYAKAERRASAKFYQRLSTEPREKDEHTETAPLSDELDRGDVLYMPPLASSDSQISTKVDLRE